MAVYDNPFGSFRLKRIPDMDKNLQAWNSADTYLLKHLSETMNEEQLQKARILILNDDFGALSVSLAKYGCDSLSDSYVSHQAINNNLLANCPEYHERVRLLKSTDSLNTVYDLILFKIPKTSAYLKQQVRNLSGFINVNSRIIGAVMAKNLQRSLVTSLEKLAGHAEASLAWKKARLVFIKADLLLESSANTGEVDTASFQLEDGSRIWGLSNVFSRNHLDIGARFFLEHFPGSLNPAPETIIDLGCGNGVLSLKAAQCYPNASIIAVDESYMAVESARMTLEDNVQDVTRLQFICSNVLEPFESERADLILCNPPFHQQHVVGDTIAWQMFIQSRRVLKQGGELWIVGNRHLAYHGKLQKVFGNQTLVATNNKFVILKAIKN